MFKRKSKPNHLQKEYVSKNIEKNKQYIKNLFKCAQDIVYRDFYIGRDKLHILIVYIDGMVDKDILNNQILKNLMVDNEYKNEEKLTLDYIKDNYLSVSEIKEYEYISELVQMVLSGDILFFADNFDKAIAIGSKDIETRSVQEPISEQTVKGPRDGFVENIKTNIILIRKRIKDINLCVEMLKIGERTKTDVGVLYLQDVADENLVENIKKKLSEVSIDGITDTGQIEQFLQEGKWSIFPLTLSTERPDRVTANILEGRVALVVDNTPFVIIAPITFSAFLSSPDDYYARSYISTVIRITRYICYIISTTLPSIYLAFTSYNPGMLPTTLALSITGTRVGLPFPSFLEVLSMVFTLEILQEAGVRLPKPIGQTVSIVGGLVLGQAAVQAGIVSPIIVVVVALTAISSFALPTYNFSLNTRLIRFHMLILSSLLGVYGIIIGWILLTIHLSSLEIFGVRYMSDFSPYNFNNMKDTILRFPIGSLNKRPGMINTKNNTRQGK